MYQKEFKTGEIEEPPGDRGKLLTQKTPDSQTGRAEEDLVAFFEVSPDLLCIAGFDGYFKRLNPAWTTILGWPIEELKAQSFLAFVHPEDREETEEEVSGLSNGSETVCFENRYRRRDGSYCWLRWNARPDIMGKARIYATARDITEYKRLEKEVLEILDHEKERLGRELHDGLCQSLAGIGALSATLSKKLLANSDSVGSAAAAEITELLNESIGDARGLARGLSPIAANVGLSDALEALALNVRQIFRVSCTLTGDRPFPNQDNEVEGHLFRIAQEAVNNAVAHGRPEQIEIRLSSAGAGGELSVRDDGVGILLNETAAEGIGMHTMAYRARMIDASLTVRKRSPRGTAVICTFPLVQEAGKPVREQEA